MSRFKKYINEIKKSKEEIKKMWQKMGWEVDVIKKGKPWPKGWTEIHPKDKKGFMKKFGVSYASIINEAPIQTKGWDEDSIKKFEKTIGIKATEKGFFDACVLRMTPKEGFDKEKAEGFCAAIKDRAFDSTHWRGKDKSKAQAKKDTKEHPYKKGD